MLGKKGMKGFTVKTVANEAGVSAGLVVYHFGGLDGLLDAVFDSVMFELPDTREFEPVDLSEAIRNLRMMIDLYFAPEYYSRSSLLVWLPLFETMLLDEAFRKRLYARDEEYIAGFAIHIERVLKFRGLDADALAIARNLMSFMDGLWLRWCHSDREDTTTEKMVAVDYLEGKIGSLETQGQSPRKE